MMLLKQRAEAFLLFLCLFFAPELLSECKPPYQLKKQWPVRWTIGLQWLHFFPVALDKMYVTTEPSAHGLLYLLAAWSYTSNLLVQQVSRFLANGIKPSKSRREILIFLSLHKDVCRKI